MNTREYLLSSAEHDGLDSFNSTKRLEAFNKYYTMLQNGGIECDPVGKRHNMHCHSFFSYNALAWSPEHLAITAKILGFSHLGMVDFDVLDGVDALKNAANKLNIKNICGMETRVFIPEMAELEINSPGEKGVAYHLALGFNSSKVPLKCASFLASLKQRAQTRTAAVVDKVNAFLDDVKLDFETEVVAATASGNPTERHVCAFYRLKAELVTGSHEKAVQYWQKMLALNEEETRKASSSNPALEGFIRSKLMKNGGPGAVKADAKSFPLIDEMNEFAAQCGAVPCPAWLNGFTSGEEDPVKLLAFHKAKGAKAVTIIPERNWNIKDETKKAASLKKLDGIINAAQKLDLHVIAGTELNTPGQRLCDAFETPELAKYYNIFKSGADAVTNGKF